MTNKNHKSNSGTARPGQLSPWPRKWNPPKEIPTTERSPKRKIVVDLLPTAGSESVIAVTAGSIRNRLVADTGTAADKIYYVVSKSAYWALPGPGQLTLQDAVSGTTVTDEGDYTNRARCGIKYPKNLQTIINPSSSGVFQTGNCDMVAGVSGAQVWTSRHWVTYWSIAPNSA